MTAFKDWLNGLTSKTTPVDADELYVRDSSGTPGSKKLTWANLKATLANTFLSLTGGTIASGTKTASDPALTVTQTWNNAGVTFTGKTTNITDTASASGSLIEDWQVGGVSKASVTKYGRFFSNSSDGGFYINSGGYAGFSLNGTSLAFFPLGQNPTLHIDVNTLALRNDTNAQTSRIYGTYTDGSNYRRVAISMTTAGVASITPEGAGTGASGNVLHISGLPTSNPGAGILWNDSGTVKVGT